MQNQWSQSGNNFSLREISNQTPLLENSVYKIEQDSRSGELYLSQTYKQFEFPYKVYGIETKFIKRVVKTYNSTKGNLGLLMNGVKGTGKTVTAKQICNELELPVLIIHTAYPGIPNFINEIQQNVVILIDEFEKVFSDRDHSVLTVMDGVMDNGFRKVFMLTTNELYINSNLIQRPGRVRYLKTYTDLPIEIITEIIDDRLIHTDLRAVTISFISQLEVITVDIVNAIIDEVNIHNEDPKEFEDVFNINRVNDRFNVYEIEEGSKPKLLYSEAKINYKSFDKRNHMNRWFEADDRTIGIIRTVIDEKNIIIEDQNEVITYNEGKDDEYDECKKVHIRIENTKFTHRSFYDL